MSTAAASSPFQIGARESQGGNRIYVNLRAGRIGQTLKHPDGSPAQVAEELKALADRGYYPQKSVSGSGKVTWFVAKTFDDLTGFVKEIRWHTKTFDSGGTQSGWNIMIDAGETGTFVLYVDLMDRPCHRVMAILLGVDFKRPVYFQGFAGENGKVLLLAQDVNPETGKPIWLQPCYQERWLSLGLTDKIRDAGIDRDSAPEKVKAFLETLPEKGKDNRNNIALTTEGKLDPTWPYIKQKVSDQKWSFDAWSEFLIGKMKDEVIPNVEEAARHHGLSTELPEPEYTGGPSTSQDDDIPF